MSDSCCFSESCNGANCLDCNRFPYKTHPQPSDGQGTKATLGSERITRENQHGNRA